MPTALCRCCATHADLEVIRNTARQSADRATDIVILGTGGPALAAKPWRSLRGSPFRAAALGELMMHFMLETIIAAHFLGVDPFDQPAVEENKVLAKKYLMS